MTFIPKIQIKEETPAGVTPSLRDKTLEKIKRVEKKKELEREKQRLQEIEDERKRILKYQNDWRLFREYMKTQFGVFLKQAERFFLEKESTAWIFESNRIQIPYALRDAVRAKMISNDESWMYENVANSFLDEWSEILETHYPKNYWQGFELKFKYQPVISDKPFNYNSDINHSYFVISLGL